MEIRPNNNIGSVPQIGETTAKPRLTPPPADAANFAESSALNSALHSLPDARPEVVATGKALVSDATYPPPVVIKRISHLIAAHLNAANAS